jgi:hypothetical protein
VFSGEVVRGLPTIRAALETFTALKPALDGEVVKVLEIERRCRRVQRMDPDKYSIGRLTLETGGTRADVLRVDSTGARRVLIDDPWVLKRQRDVPFLRTR